MKKRFGTYNSREEAETASGIEAIELRNSGFDGKIK